VFFREPLSAGFNLKMQQVINTECVPLTAREKLANP
jgi:hypothetical protein